MNEHQANNDQPIENDIDAIDHRQQIVQIEYFIATTDPRLFTVESVNNFIHQVNGVINWVRNNIDKVAYDTKELHRNLYDAQTHLIVAIEERNKGKTTRYCNCLKSAGEFFDAALTCWETLK